MGGSNRTVRERKASPVEMEVYKQLGVVGLVFAIGFWQLDFVVQTANADIYLFSLIVGVGLFGICNGIIGTYALRNDYIALEAMKELHQDLRRKSSAPEDHARVVEQRIGSDLILHNPPSSLGTAYNLIVEEVLRTGALRVPIGTMQILVTDFENKLDARQSMLHYLGGLMVLLGLLGTFIGLMKTLESVGGILGSLDLSGSAGAGAIASLIESLKRPLEGMATGFGSSLFGLVGSLMIGLLARFDSRASNGLKHDFETWLRNAVQFESAGRGGAAAGGTVATTLDDREVGNWRAVFLVARHTVQANARVSAQIATLTEGIATLSRDIRNQAATTSSGLTHVVRALEHDAEGHGRIAHGIDRLSEANAQTRQTLEHALGTLSGTLAVSAARQEAASLELGAEVRKLATEHGSIVRGLDQLKDASSDMRQRIATHLAEISETMVDRTARQEAVGIAIGDGLGKLSSDTRVLARNIERLAGVSVEGRAAVTEGLSRLSDGIAIRLDRSEATDQSLGERLDRLTSELRLSHDLASDAARRVEVAETGVADLQSARRRDAVNRQTPEREAEELVANLNHLISATRLDTGEVERLRRMAELMRSYEEAGGQGDDVILSRLAERS